MPVIVGLVGATLCALIVVLAAETVSDRGVVGDTENTERWLVDRIGRLPGLRLSLVNNSLKWLVMRERPPVDRLVGSGNSSFPSGHAAAAAACWAAIAIVVSRRMHVRARRWTMAIAVAVTVLVAASRVMLGVHWLTDVIAGVLVGWAWCFLVALVFGGRIQRFGEPAERVRVDEAAARDERRANTRSRPSDDTGVLS